MQHTLSSLGRTWQGLVSRPLLALCLGLAPVAPAHAGWLNQLFGKPQEVKSPTIAEPVQAKTETAADAPAPAATDAPPEEVVTILPTEDTTSAEDEDEPLLPDMHDIAQAGNLWERARSGFKLDLTLDNDRIAAQRNWYAQHQSHLDRVAIRASRYLFHTVSEAEKRGLPTELALLPIIESAYDPFAYSRASAAGIWQFIPGTGKIFGLKQNWWFDGRRDLIESTRAAYDFLTQLQTKFGSWELALAAYNAGPGAVQRAIDRNVAEGLPTDFWSLRLPAETMSYVPRFLAMAQLIKSPESFGLSLRPVVDQPYFRIVGTNGQIDLAAAASLAGVSLKELYQLNPGFSRWATDPEGPHRLLVPASLPVDFEQQIAALPAPERMIVEHYRVKRGDNLFKIAKHFGVSPAELKRMNKLRTNRVATGSTLVVTRARASSEAYTLSQDQRIARSEKAEAGKTTRYKVRRGDTLSSVARKSGVSVLQLARLNGLGAKSRLKPGQSLKILKSQQESSTRTASRAGGKKNTKRISYEVRKGDTLFSIGKRYNVSVKQIRNWNSASRSIRPGQDLVIFVASNNPTRQGSL